MCLDGAENNKKNNVALNILLYGMKKKKNTWSDILTLEHNTVFPQCVCAPGRIGEFCQYVGDACLIKANSCLNGATCITTSRPSSSPQYTCKCPLGFTGEIALLCSMFYFDCYNISQDVQNCPNLCEKLCHREENNWLE